jgi:hypothetical protein
MYSSYQLLLPLRQQFRPHVLPPSVTQPEVNELQLEAASVEEHKVFRLEVSVGYLMGMAIAESLHNLDEDPSCVLFREAALLVESIEQFSTITETSIN